MVNDIIGDMITRIRNANSVKARVVYVPSTKITTSIANILKKEGFIHSFGEQTLEQKGCNYPVKLLCLSLKYKGLRQKPYITQLKRVSKPGLRSYVNHKKVPKVLNGIGIAILSTSQGLMTDSKARLLKVGGEVLCYVW